MSRIGQAPIEIPKGTKLTVEGDGLVKVKGPQGELSHRLPASISLEVDGSTALLQRAKETKEVRALHGLSRALVANMVTGVTEGFTRRLQIEGVGYRAELDGKRLRLRVGYSHDVFVEPLAGVEIGVEGNQGQVVVVKGADKQAVGQMAANIRKIRPVEPYKGKGIRYQGERVRRKASKSAKVGA